MAGVASIRSCGADGQHGRLSIDRRDFDYLQLHQRLWKTTTVDFAVPACSRKSGTQSAAAIADMMKPAVYARSADGTMFIGND